MGEQCIRSISEMSKLRFGEYKQLVQGFKMVCVNTEPQPLIPEPKGSF